MPSDKTLIYVGDPMCSWCWGFIPQYEKIYREFHDDFNFEILVGGLRAAQNAVELNFDLKMFLLNHWVEVGNKTGQKFNLEFLNKKNFLYDTYNSCSAVIAMQKLNSTRALDYFIQIQRKFYVENEDPTELENLIAWSKEYYSDEKKFAQVLMSQENHAETFQNFETAQKLGVIGFPTVIYKKDHCHQILCSGYQSFETLAKRIQELTEL